MHETPIVVFDTNVVEEERFRELKNLAEKREIELKIPTKVIREINNHPDKKRERN